MRRAIERLLEDPLAEALLRGDVKPGDKIEAAQNKESGEIIFIPVVEKKKPAPRKKPTRKPKGGIEGD